MSPASPKRRPFGPSDRASRELRSAEKDQITTTGRKRGATPRATRRPRERGVLPNQHGISIQLVLVDGVPDGLWRVDKQGSTGIGLMWPRALHARAREREELTRAGVYVLVERSNDGAEKPRIYVGEAEVLRERLDRQQVERDFWTHAIAFSTKDGSLNKAHVRYLEWRLLQLAQMAQRAEIMNNNVPAAPNLTEADVAYVEAFLDEMLLIYPVLDVKAFKKLDTTEGTGKRLRLAGAGAQAEGAEAPDGFIVFAGSLARQTVAPLIQTYLSERRRKLVEEGIVEESSEGLRFTQDYVFNSPRPQPAYSSVAPRTGELSGRATRAGLSRTSRQQQCRR